MKLIENYVVSLIEEILGAPAVREAKFDWALGDPSPKDGRRRKLPFDAFWARWKLIVEVDEDQHREPTPFFDKPDVLTVSGVHRGTQRRIYDERKRAAAVEAGYVLLEVPWDRKPQPHQRDRVADLELVRGLLRQRGILPLS